MFERLLLAVDGSPSSEVAISFAASLAEPGAGSVHVVHVNEYVVGGRGVTLSTSREAVDLVADAVRQLQSAGLRADGSVCVGSYREVATRIVEAASRRSADGILLGSRRRRRLGRLPSPRVRERTLRLTSLPVVVAPAPLGLPKRVRLELDESRRQQPEREASGSR
jgi:nucleotide-binding universal stress UspA family protein